jgi:hypothetical protein
MTRTRDLQACSIAPKPTVLPRDQIINREFNYLML